MLLPPLPRLKRRPFLSFDSLPSSVLLVMLLNDGDFGGDRGLQFPDRGGPGEQTRGES